MINSTQKYPNPYTTSICPWGARFPSSPRAIGAFPRLSGWRSLVHLVVCCRAAENLCFVLISSTFPVSELFLWIDVCWWHLPGYLRRGVLAALRMKTLHGYHFL